MTLVMSGLAATSSIYRRKGKLEATVSLRSTSKRRAGSAPGTKKVLTADALSETDVLRTFQGDGHVFHSCQASALLLGTTMHALRRARRQYLRATLPRAAHSPLLLAPMTTEGYRQS